MVFNVVSWFFMVFFVFSRNFQGFPGSFLVFQGSLLVSCVSCFMFHVFHVFLCFCYLSWFDKVVSWLYKVMFHGFVGCSCLSTGFNA